MTGWEVPPKPFQIKSLKGLSDGEIASFMSGKRAVSSFEPADAPDTHFPDNLWGMAPKAAALAFAEANRRPAHRKDFMLCVDPGPSLKPPADGWIVFDPGSASCPLSSSGTQTLIALRFGIDQPFLFHSQTQERSLLEYNPYVDASTHSQQHIPLSPHEARFIADTVFWLEHIKSTCRSGGALSSHCSSTSDSYGRLDWLVSKNPPRRIGETLWSGSSIAGRWSGDYDAEISLNLIYHLLLEAVPRRLDKRWQSAPSFARDDRNTPLAERITRYEDDATKDKLGRGIVSALKLHSADPWPADALVALAECAGDCGLQTTLPALETLMRELPPPSADELELRTLDARFQDQYLAPTDPGERMKWDRHQLLQTALEHDVPTRLRPQLATSIRQIRALGQAVALVELTKNDDETAMWALRRLYQSQPDIWADALIARYSTGKEWDRRRIFETLAALNPGAARRLRDSLTQMETGELLVEIARFELVDDPQGARVRIPALFDLADGPTETHAGDSKPSPPCNPGAAIEVLAKMPLNSSEQQRFGQLLLRTLLAPKRDEASGGYPISEAALACLTQASPDRFWDALYQAASVQKDSWYFKTLLDALATLAIANPEPRLPQLVELLRSRINQHKGCMDTLCMVSLALDLRTLAPDIQHFATSSFSVPDGDYETYCKEVPCHHRYHCARHVTALWLEPDADTRARMWTALLLESPHDFEGDGPVVSCLRNQCRSAIAAATPELRGRLSAQIRSSPFIVRGLID